MCISITVSPFFLSLFSSILEWNSVTPVSWEKKFPRVDAYESQIGKSGLVDSKKREKEAQANNKNRRHNSGEGS